MTTLSVSTLCLSTNYFFWQLTVQYYQRITTTFCIALCMTIFILCMFLPNSLNFPLFSLIEKFQMSKWNPGGGGFEQRNNVNYMCNKFLINALYLVEEYHYFPLCCNFSWGIQLKIFLLGRDGGFWGKGVFCRFELISYRWLFFLQIVASTYKERKKCFVKKSL